MNEKALLCILDGWGLRKTSAEDDATRKGPFFHQLWGTVPHVELQASGEHVGLPEGQPGNSEVGHTVLGLGRVLLQNLVRVDRALESGTLLLPMKEAIQRAKDQGSALHLWGLVSTGGVHSHLRHFLKILEYLAPVGLPIFIHAVLDGRDVGLKTARGCLKTLMDHQPPHISIASLCGRFYAMDRDQRWDRTEDAYRVVAEHEGYLTAPTWQTVFDDEYYNLLVSDEFMEPVAIGAPYAPSSDDILLCLNYRSDRARQMAQALGAPQFSHFHRKEFPRFSAMFSLTDYATSFRSFCTPLLERESDIHSLGEVLSDHGKTQLRLAESEKYAHITFFLNGGREEAFPGEHRIVVPSPQVATYQQSPSMSAERITCEAIQALQKGVYDFITINYANADMVGHTGHFKATELAIACLDQCLRHLVAAASQAGYGVFITADHGNAEQMLTSEGTPHTYHTTNPVPFLLIDPMKVASLQQPQLGSLADVAPTILSYLHLPVPQEMMGRSLLLRG